MSWDTEGSLIGAVRLDPAQACGDVPGLLERTIKQGDDAAWALLKQRIDYVYDRLGYAVAPVLEEGRPAAARQGGGGGGTEAVLQAERRHRQRARLPRRRHSGAEDRCGGRHPLDVHGRASAVLPRRSASASARWLWAKPA